MRQLVLFLLLISSCFAQADVLDIGIKNVPPFAFKDEQGQWTGLSVDLLRVVAKEHTLHFIEASNVYDLLSLAESKQVDVSIGAISMTPERETFIDFSHPYFTTSQGVFVYENNNVAWFVLKRILIGLTVFIVVLYVVGWIQSRLDPHDAIDNIHKGAWFALVTFTTTGYGDYVPQNARSKIFAAILMISSMFLLATFTGYMSSSFTVRQLTNAPTSMSDLFRVDVIAVDGTTGDQFLTKLGIHHKTVSNVQQGITSVMTNTSGAFVYDKSILDFSTKKLDNNKIKVWAIDSKTEQYAFTFPSNSKLIETFNVSILQFIQTDEWKHLVANYFGN